MITAAILSPFGVEQPRRGGRVVERQHASQVGEGFGHALRRRVSERCKTRAGGDEQIVNVAVVAARELDDEIAARRAAREPHRAHDGFGAGRHEPHLLDTGIRSHDLLGQLDFRRRGRSKRGAAATRGLHCRENFRMRSDPRSAVPTSPRNPDIRGRRRQRSSPRSPSGSRSACRRRCETPARASSRRPA